MSDGLSVRFVRHYNAADDTWRNTTSGVDMNVAFGLAVQDERDVPFAQKMADAHDFLKRRVN